MAKTTLQPLVGLSDEELEDRVPNREGGFIWLQPEIPEAIPFRIGLILELDCPLSIGDLLELNFGIFRALNIYVEADAMPVVVAKEDGEQFDVGDVYDAPEYTGEWVYLEH